MGGIKTFWTIFRRKGGGLGRVKKILIRKNWGGQKRGRGRGGLRILTESKKIPVFFIDASPKWGGVGGPLTTCILSWWMYFSSMCGKRMSISSFARPRRWLSGIWNPATGSAANLSLPVEDTKRSSISQKVTLQPKGENHAEEHNMQYAVILCCNYRDEDKMLEIPITWYLE